MNPQVRTGLTHAGTAVGGIVAAIAFLSSKSVDIYALWDQLNSVVAGITALIAAVTPLATAAYGIYMGRTQQTLVDVAAAAKENPKAVVEAAKTIPPTPELVAVAEALKKQP